MNSEGMVQSTATEVDPWPAAKGGCAVEIHRWNAELPASAQARRAYRGRGLSNLLTVGHCAPAVAQTILDVTDADEEWLVRLAAGLPGGIGNTGGECGGVTAALLLLGLRYGGSTERGLPVIFEKGHAYCQRFLQCNRSLLCSSILGKRRLPLPCLRVVRRAPELFAETVASDAVLAIPPEDREAYRRLHSHLSRRGFHCAHAVLRKLDHAISVTPELLAATSGFVGGTLLEGMTCSALTAGVMAIGLRAGEIETSRRRVVRMLVTMAVGGDALDDELNKFNRSVNRGKALARWFAGEFGSPQCRAITGCSFSSTADVERYIQGEQVTRCETIARRVAEEAGAILERAQVH
jgi:C_GCAxxG_C_C family probable redox protein